MATRIASRAATSRRNRQGRRFRRQEDRALQRRREILRDRQRMQHRKGPLGEGTLDGTTVTCPWHGWEYDVTTGANLDDENVKVGCYPVKLEGDDFSSRAERR